MLARRSVTAPAASAYSVCTVGRSSGCPLSRLGASRQGVRRCSLASTDQSQAHCRVPGLSFLARSWNRPLVQVNGSTLQSGLPCPAGPWLSSPVHATPDRAGPCRAEPKTALPRPTRPKQNPTMPRLTNSRPWLAPPNPTGPCRDRARARLTPPAPDLGGPCLAPTCQRPALAIHAPPIPAGADLTNT